MEVDGPQCAAHREQHLKASSLAQKGQLPLASLSTTFQQATNGKNLVSPFFLISEKHREADQWTVINKYSLNVDASKFPTEEGEQN